MPHALETAPTARSKCRGCEQRIAAGALRLGESLPNPFAEGETLHWFHPDCAAWKRPEVFLEVLATRRAEIPEADRLEAEAQQGVAHPRLPRASGVERAASGRAACRHCKSAIEKDAWRIALVFHEEGRFSPAGYLHLACAGAYLEAPGVDLMSRLRRFSPELSDADAEEVAAALEA
jgi:hypothetical protein